MNLEKIIRFGFASPRRKVMTLVLAGAAGITGLLGVGADKTPTTTTTPTTTPAAVQAGSVENVVENVSYGSCADVRAAGKAPLHKGDPGYSSTLDRDGDGTACDS